MQSLPTLQNIILIHYYSRHVDVCEVLCTCVSAEKNDTSYKRAGFFTEMKQKKIQNLKWPPQKNLIFQLRQFSIFFHENFMD